MFTAEFKPSLSFHSFLFISLITLSGFLYSDEDADKKFAEIEKAQDEFFEKVKEKYPNLNNAKSKHFHINYTMKLDPFTANFGKSLEGFLGIFKKFLRVPSNENLYDGRLEIYFWEDRQDFITFARDYEKFDASRAGGYFTITPMGWPRINMPMENSFGGIDASRRRALVVLYHEATHAIFAKYRSDVSLPTWLNEGLAEYFAYKTIDMYYKKFRGMDNDRMGHIKYIEDGVKSGKIRSFRELFFQRGTAGGADQGSYAISWAVVSFMGKNYLPQLGKLIHGFKDSELLQKYAPGKKITGADLEAFKKNPEALMKQLQDEQEKIFEAAFNMKIDEFGEKFYEMVKKSPSFLRNLRK